MTQFMTSNLATVILLDAARLRSRRAPHGYTGAAAVLSAALAQAWEMWQGLSRINLPTLALSVLVAGISHYHQGAEIMQQRRDDRAA
jgi:hypothetical protein